MAHTEFCYIFPPAGNILPLMLPNLKSSQLYLSEMENKLHELWGYPDHLCNKQNSEVDGIKYAFLCPSKTLSFFFSYLSLPDSQHLRTHKGPIAFTQASSTPTHYRAPTLGSPLLLLCPPAPDNFSPHSHVSLSVDL